MSQDADLTARVKAAAEVAGFARTGIAEARALEEEAAHLDDWLAAGRHGQMSWMATTASVRKDPRNPNMVEKAKSVIVMAAPYVRRHGYQGPPPARIAKYAMGRDYHNVLTKKSHSLPPRSWKATGFPIVFTYRSVCRRRTSFVTTAAAALHSAVRSSRSAE